MSDPRYMHKFNPNRHGRCKTIIGDRHCGELENHIVHTRYEAHEREKNEDIWDEENPFEQDRLDQW